MLVSAALAAQEISIQRDGRTFKVIGWTPGQNAPAEGGWAALFSVYAGTGDVPPMLGSYAIEGGSLVFRPRFALGADVPVRAIFRPLEGRPIEVAFPASSLRATPSTRVDHVYPSADVLPANQLKFYVHFSAPMARGEAWRRVHLLNDKGVEVVLPFLEIDQELWDHNNERLTVLFDPGRIKRGVL